MGEITKGKKTDERFRDSQEIDKEVPTPDHPEEKQAFLDTSYENQNEAQSTIELEEPPTYDTVEEMIAEEKEIQKEKTQQNKETENSVLPEEEEQTKEEESSEQAQTSQSSEQTVWSETMTSSEETTPSERIQEGEELEQKITICRKCGAILKETDRFCSNCGEKVGPEDETQMIAATKEDEPSDTSLENHEDGQEVPKIDEEALKRSVEQAQKDLENQKEWGNEKEGNDPSQQSQNPDLNGNGQESVIHYTEEERLQQVLRMREQEINYGRQLEQMEQEEKPKKKRKVWKIVLGTVVLLIILAVAGIYAAGVYHFQDRFFPNTTINGVDVSEDTIQEVNQYLGDEIAKYQIAVKERNGVTEYLTSDDLGYGYVPLGGIETLKEKQNPFLWPEFLMTTYSYSITPNVSYSSETVKQSVQNMACFQEENIVKPQNAYVEYNGETYQIVPEVEGNELDLEKVTQLVLNAVETGANEISLEDAGCYLEPSRRQDDETMNSAVNQLNTYLSTNIEYIFGANREVLDGSIIKDWISFNEETFEVTFDDAKLTEYVAGLAEKYDTYNKDRQFTTNDGSVVTVSGGSGYGWMIDQEAEVQEVKEWIAQGTQNIRYAVFAREAVSWDNCDLGDSYIEIDLTNQHVWLYIDGEEIVSTDCVSGDMTIAGRSTPAGTYTLYYKESPSILKGEGYEQEVQYWMPFNNDVGLHDASWRTEFGGDIYISNGSHGCVNLPSSAAKTIYDNIYPGIPIICYYR